MNWTRIKRFFHPANLIPLLFIAGLLYAFHSYMHLPFKVKAGTPVYENIRGQEVLQERLPEERKARIIRYNYGKYLVEFSNGDRGLIPAGQVEVRVPRTKVRKRTITVRKTNTIRGKKIVNRYLTDDVDMDIDTSWEPVPNRLVYHFFPKVFSKSDKENEMPFVKERHNRYYVDKWKSRDRAVTDSYWRLVFPFILILAAAFLMAFGGRIFKPVTAIIFFTIMLLYSLYAAGIEYRVSYGYVSYFRQVSIRIPYEYKGPIFVPDTQWLIRVKAYTGLKNNVRELRYAAPNEVKGAFIVAGSQRGYTPGWAWAGPGKTQLYQNGPTRLIHADGYFQKIINRIPDEYIGPVYVPHEVWSKRLSNARPNLEARLLEEATVSEVSRHYLILDRGWGETPPPILEKCLHPDYLPGQDKPIPASKLADSVLPELSNPEQQTLSNALRRTGRQYLLAPGLSASKRQELARLLAKGGLGWTTIYREGPARLLLAD